MPSVHCKWSSLVFNGPFISANLIHIWHTSRRSFSFVQSMPEHPSSPTCKHKIHTEIPCTAFVGLYMYNFYQRRSPWRWTQPGSRSVSWGRWPGWPRWPGSESVWSPCGPDWPESCTRAATWTDSRRTLRDDSPAPNDHYKEQPSKTQNSCKTLHVFQGPRTSWAIIEDEKWLKNKYISLKTTVVYNIVIS